MAVPKRRHSNARTGSRRAHDAKKPRHVMSCPQCSTAVYGAWRYGGCYNGDVTFDYRPGACPAGCSEVGSPSTFCDSLTLSDAGGTKYRYKKTYTANLADFDASKSKYSKKIKLGTEGKWRIKAFYAATNEYAETSSSWKYISVY